MRKIDSTTSLLFLLIIMMINLSQGDTWEFSRHLSTKTPYFPKNITSEPPPSCVPVHFQIVSRHGSRSPTMENIVKYKMIEGKIFDAIDYIKLGWLKNWKSPFKETDEGNLVVPGQNELYNLGKRFNDKYQSLFPDNQYNPISYPLQTTFVPRVSMSGNAFGYAIFGEAEGHVGPGHYQPIYSFTDMKGKDINLRFFEACKKYVDHMNDTEHVEDKVKFADKYFPSIAERVTAMIGAAPNFVITRENVTSFYDLCSFEYVIYNITSQFCSLFVREDFEIFEMYYDIGSYHIKGYGWDLSYQIACPLVKDIVDKFNAKINGSDKFTKAFLRFGHAETILPLLSILGLYKDDFPLKWDTKFDSLRNRKWRMSEISSFSSNVVFILHNCSTGYKVETQHNEGQVILDGCNGEVFCPYDLFLKKMDFINNCNFDKMCDSSLTQCLGSDISPTIELTALFGLFIICILSIIIGAVVYIKQSREDRNPYHEQVY